MRSFKFKNEKLTIKSPDAGIHAFGKKFNLPVVGGKLDMAGQPDEKYSEIRDALLAAGYIFN